MKANSIILFFGPCLKIPSQNFPFKKRLIKIVIKIVLLDKHVDLVVPLGSFYLDLIFMTPKYKHKSCQKLLNKLKTSYIQWICASDFWVGISTGKDFWVGSREMNCDVDRQLLMRYHWRCCNTTSLRVIFTCNSVLSYSLTNLSRLCFSPMSCLSCLSVRILVVTVLMIKGCILWDTVFLLNDAGFYTEGLQMY